MQTYLICKELLVSINNYAMASQCQKTFYLKLEKTALILKGLFTPFFSNAFIFEFTVWQE